MMAEGPNLHARLGAELSDPSLPPKHDESTLSATLSNEVNDGIALGIARKKIKGVSETKRDDNQSGEYAHGVKA